MPKVVDAARVTSPSNTVWRTCDRCSRLTPLPDGVNRCDDCTGTDRPPTVAEMHAAAGWNFANRYAELVGAINAWAELIPGVSDAERLDKIRHLLKTRSPLQRDGEAK